VHPGLELVGCYAHAKAKVGRDVGELCGIASLGVTATDDVEKLLALRPDCLLYMPLFPDVDVMERFLAAGVDVVSTAYFITGRALGADATARLEAAARRGGATLYGSGIYPGLANAFALVSSGVCRRVDRISVLESVDCTHYASGEMWRQAGIGRPVGDPELPALARSLTSVFSDAVEMMARALAAPLDEIRYDVEFAAATRRIELSFLTIEPGCAAGLRHRWSGIVAGRPLIELGVVWKLGSPMQPDWPLENGYRVEIDGLPGVRARLEIVHPEGWAAPDFGTITAMPAVHAIPAVCAAAPGIVHAHELPLVVAAHVAGVPR
jgi:hypothetical protein